LQRISPSDLESIVVPVPDSIQHVKNLQLDMSAARRGAFLILRGDSGSGKSTFLNTLGFFLDQVETLALNQATDIVECLRRTEQTPKRFRVIILEGRDALKNVRHRDLEAAIHEINMFLRSAKGERTLVVWPVNADDLERTLVRLARRVGGDALLGVADPSYKFSGPPKSEYIDIARRTIATLNQGASLADLGVSEQRAAGLAANSNTVGCFLGLLRQDLTRNRASVEGLLEKERCRLWIVVAAANDPVGDVAGLTRGALSTADTEALLSATNANIVEELKRFPDKLGILAAVLDAKILHLPSVTALAVVRDYGDEKLRTAMTAGGLSTKRAGDATERLKESELGHAFTRTPRGTGVRGPKMGSNTKGAFEKLAKIATKNDGWLNAALGRALNGSGLISAFETEKTLGSGLTRYTDLACETSLGTIRLEIMWRAKTNRAAIANYTLTKLNNYGRAIGFLD
jgi:energy-coupling factor transporter ATP-binding protein EcfA2